jgi:hypothetical protein
VYPRAIEFIAALRDRLTNEILQRSLVRRRCESLVRNGASRTNVTIDDFRENPRYAGDGNRIDLAYAIYALSHGATESEIAQTIADRDLSKKGSDRRQQEYVTRTIEKAQSIVSAATLAHSCIGR